MKSQIDVWRHCGSEDAQRSYLSPLLLHTSLLAPFPQPWQRLLLSNSRGPALWWVRIPQALIQQSDRDGWRCSIFLQGSLGPSTSLPSIHLTPAAHEAWGQPVTYLQNLGKPGTWPKQYKPPLFLHFKWYILHMLNTRLLQHCWLCPILTLIYSLICLWHLPFPTMYFHSLNSHYLWASFHWVCSSNASFICRTQITGNCK